MSRNARIALVVAALAVAVAAFVIASSSSDDSEDERPASTAPATATAPQGGRATTAAPPAPPPIPVIRVRDGKPAGGVAKIAVHKGERLRFRVLSDAPHEVHAHGFDVLKQVAPGTPASFNLKASFTGRFEVELEDTGTQIARLEIRP